MLYYIVLHYIILYYIILLCYIVLYHIQGVHPGLLGERADLVRLVAAAPADERQHPAPPRHNLI